MAAETSDAAGAQGRVEEEHVGQSGGLLKRRSFAPLFWVQALGAFNDNVFKTAFVSLMTYVLASRENLNLDVLVPAAAAIFIIPFALFAPFAGQIADRVDKARMMRWVKFSEIIIMCGAAFAYIYTSVEALFLLLFLMGAQSAFFSPIKYGVLPQYLPNRDLVKGNGLIQAATFVAILGGTIAGTNLVLTPQGAEIVAGVVIVVAVVGWFASLYALPARRAPSIEPLVARSFVDGSLRLRQLVGGVRPATVFNRFGLFFAIWAAIFAAVQYGARGGGPFESLADSKDAILVGSGIVLYAIYLLWPSILDSLNSARREKKAYNAIRAIAWFWFVGATYLAILPILVSKQLSGDETVLTLLLAAFSVGVGIGSVLTGALYRSGVRIGFAPWGAIGIAIFSIDLAFAIEVRPEGAQACELTFRDGALVPTFEGVCRDIEAFFSDALGWRIFADFVLLATCAGVYLTPLNAVYQAEAPADARGRVVACSNMIDSTFMALSSVAIILLGMASLSEQEILGLLGSTGFVAAIVVARWAPETRLGKFAGWILPSSGVDAS